MSHKILLPKHFLKFYSKPNAWLRECLPSKTYDFFSLLCHSMNNFNKYRPAISLRDTYKELMKDSSDRNARRMETDLRKIGAIRLSQQNPEVWEICPRFAVKNKFLSGNILLGWCKEIPYTRDFEDHWSTITKDKHRNLKYAPLDESPEESEGEDIMLRQELDEIKSLLKQVLVVVKKYEPAEAEKIERHLRLVKKNDSGF